MRPSTVEHGLPVCPITLQPILDPVKSPKRRHSGLVYEREAIEEWINNKRKKGEEITCPKSRKPLSHPLVSDTDYHKKVTELQHDQKQQWLAELYLIKKLERLPLLTNTQKKNYLLAWELQFNHWKEDAATNPIPTVPKDYYDQTVGFLKYLCAQQPSLLSSFERLQPEIFSLTDRQQCNIAHYSARNSLFKATQWLLANQPELFDQPNIDGNTPAHLAAQKGDNGIINLIYTTYPALVLLTNNAGKNVFQAAGKLTRDMLTQPGTLITAPCHPKRKSQATDENPPKQVKHY